MLSHRLLLPLSLSLGSLAIAYQDGLERGGFWPFGLPFLMMIVRMSGGPSGRLHNKRALAIFPCPHSRTHKYKTQGQQQQQLLVKRRRRGKKEEGGICGDGSRLGGTPAPTERTRQRTGSQRAIRQGATHTTSTATLFPLFLLFF